VSRKVSLLEERREPSSVDERRACAWCRQPRPTTRGRFCCKRCRQTAFRLRRRGQVETQSERPLRFAYADPPYPGTARKYYAKEPTYAGEVDHRKLVASLESSYDGWALSTSAKALRDILPLCPPGVRVCAWVKPHPPCIRTFGLHNCWEALIVSVGRPRRPGVRDWLQALPARGGGELPGRKPLAFCAWLFECLGMLPGDELIDLFPGSGVVSRAWRELSRRSSATSPGAGAERRPVASPTPAGRSVASSTAARRSGVVPAGTTGGPIAASA